MVAIIDLTAAVLLVVFVILLAHVASMNRYPMAWVTIVGEGERVYTQKCASCHGKDGTGDPALISEMPVPDLSCSDIQDKNEDLLFRAIANSPDHPAFRRQLDDEKIRRVIAYLRTLDRQKRFPGSRRPSLQQQHGTW